MGEHQGHKVAVKVLRVYSTSDFKKITSVSHRPMLGKSLYRRSDDPCDRIDILQGSYNMEDPSPSKRGPAVRGDDGGKSLCNGLGMDGQWKYQ